MGLDGNGRTNEQLNYDCIKSLTLYCLYSSPTQSANNIKAAKLEVLQSRNYFIYLIYFSTTPQTPSTQNCSGSTLWSARLSALPVHRTSHLYSLR